MTNTAHTPGPWFVVRYGDGDSLVICRDEAGDQRVAFMATPGCRDQLERKKAWKRIKRDANLIAAAPELLSALKECADWFVGGGTEPDAAALRALVAKATGQAVQS